MWLFAVVILVVLMIPLAAIVLDSELGRALAQRLGRRDELSGDDVERVERLEHEVRYLSETVQSLQEETRFIRDLLEEPESREHLPPGES